MYQGLDYTKTTYVNKQNEQESNHCIHPGKELCFLLDQTNYNNFNQCIHWCIEQRGCRLYISRVHFNFKVQTLFTDIDMQVSVCAIKCTFYLFFLRSEF